MKQIEFQCAHGYTQLSVSDAELLIKELEEKIRRAKITSGPLAAYATEGDLINRSGFYDFFQQYLPANFIPNRAGKLYAAIIQSGMGYGANSLPLPIGIRCESCGKPLIEECKFEYGHRYYYTGRDYSFSIAALEKCKAHFLSGGSYALSGRRLQDFELLLGHL